jgi:hypothetical protein
LVRCTSYITKPIEHGKVWTVLKAQLAQRRSDQVVSTF